MKVLLLILLAFTSFSHAQLGLTKADYDSKFGACFDNELPSPTGENWAQYDYKKYKCRVAVLFKDKKAVFVTFMRGSIFGSRDRAAIQNMFEEGEWQKNPKHQGGYVSPSKNIFCDAIFKTMSFSHRMKNVTTDTQHQIFQREFQLRRAPSFGRVSKKNNDVPLAMKPEEVDRILGAPSSSREGSGTTDKRYYYKEAYKYIVRFNKKYKVSDKVTISQKGSFTSSKFLEEIKGKLSKKWEVKGDTLMSSDRKYVIVVKLSSLEIIYARVAAKYSKLDDAPTYRIGNW